MYRVLLTSFEPFGGFALNSSLEVGRLVAASVGEGIELDWMILPVVAGACVERVGERLEHSSPDLVVCLGQANGSPRVRLEDRGINLDHFNQPDNAGALRVKQPIVPAGPPLLRTTAPLEMLLARLADEGHSIEHSLTAGSYVCNHLYYSLLHRCGERPRVLFIHLPLMPGQSPPERPMPSLPAGAMAEVVRRVIELCADGVTSEDGRAQ